MGAPSGSYEEICMRKPGVMVHISTLVSILLCVANLFFTGVIAKEGYCNDWPIVGVFTQPSTSEQGNCGGDCLYLAASYVKFIEAAGARVVPINYYASEEELGKLFDSLNGFFFVGGGAAYPPSAQYIFDRTVEANDKDDFAPLLGVCMGFQWTMLAATNNKIQLDPHDGTQMDAENISLPLDFTGAEKKSRMFKNAPTKVMKILSEQNVTMNNHHYGIFTSTFESTSMLSDFYNNLSTNKDRQGTEFVSTVEAFKYPIYATQWHPEKNIYEWQKVNGIPYEAINHSPDAVLISQYMADFFVQETRKSTHQFEDPATEQASLIWNYPAVATSGDFVQKYFFENSFKSFNG